MVDHFPVVPQAIAFWGELSENLKPTSQMITTWIENEVAAGGDFVKYVFILSVKFVVGFPQSIPDNYKEQSNQKIY